MEFITLDVKQRESVGKSATRRARRAGSVPIVLYGMQRRNLSLELSFESLEKFLRTGSHLVELRLGADTRPAIVREVQYDPLTSEVIHVDFQRVDKDHEIDDDVPVVLRGVAKGAKEGGVLQHLRDRVGVRARPRDLPKEIVVDISDLGVGDGVHVSQLTLPPGVTPTDEPHTLVVQVTEFRPQIVETPAEVIDPAAVPTAAAPAEGAAPKAGAAKPGPSK